MLSAFGEIADRNITYIAVDLSLDSNMFYESVFEGHCFKSKYKVEITAVATVKSISSKVFQESFQKLHSRYLMCVPAEGEYFEYGCVYHIISINHIHSESQSLIYFTPEVKVS